MTSLCDAMVRRPEAFGFPVWRCTPGVALLVREGTPPGRRPAAVGADWPCTPPRARAFGGTVPSPGTYIPRGPRRGGSWRPWGLASLVLHPGRAPSVARSQVLIPIVSASQPSTSQPTGLNTGWDGARSKVGPRGCTSRPVLANSGGGTRGRRGRSGGPQPAQAGHVRMGPLPVSSRRARRGRDLCRVPGTRPR